MEFNGINETKNREVLEQRTNEEFGIVKNMGVVATQLGMVFDPATQSYMGVAEPK